MGTESNVSVKRFFGQSSLPVGIYPPSRIAEDLEGGGPRGAGEKKGASEWEQRRWEMEAGPALPLLQALVWSCTGCFSGKWHFS